MDLYQMTKFKFYLDKGFNQHSIIPGQEKDNHTLVGKWHPA